MSLKNRLNELMVQYRFHPSKKMGQVLMVDEPLLLSLVQAGNPLEKDTVLEIGCGTGFLTEKILATGAKVVGVELDAKMVGLLQNEITAASFTLLPGNILEVPLPAFNKIIANPPYTISRALMYWLFQHSFECAVLTFQQEFVHKLMAEPGFEEYNALSVLTQYHYSIELMNPKISPKSFYPNTGLFSAAVRLTPRKKIPPARDEAGFAEFIKCLFRYKNKNVRNALAKSIPLLEGKCRLDAAKCEKVLKESPLMDEKVSLVENPDWVALFNALSAEGKE